MSDIEGREGRETLNARDQGKERKREGSLWRERENGKVAIEKEARVYHMERPRRHGMAHMKMREKGRQQGKSMTSAREMARNSIR